jgi:hypothetical protein
VTCTNKKMSTREQFEQSWASRFVSVSAEVPPVPCLSCWDVNGAVKSEEAVRDELKQCRQRIAKLQRCIANEELLEIFCCQWLDKLQDCESSVVNTSVGNENSLLTEADETTSRKLTNDGCEIETRHSDDQTSPSIENEYVSPADCILSAPRSESPENPYCEPFVPPQLSKRIDQSMKPTQVLKIRNNVERTRPHASYEITDIQLEQVLLQSNDENEHSSDDDSYANLLALRQSVSRVSQYCIDSGSARQQLEVQAQRLSTRFSCMFEKKSGDLSLDNDVSASTRPNGGLQTVLESLTSPTPSVSGNSFIPLT